MKQSKGTITEKGYLNIWHNGKYRKEHRVIWEKHHGDIPAGMHIHHKDGNKLNNDIANLQLINPLEHNRLRKNYRLISKDTWEKQCASCKEWLPLNAYSSYRRRNNKSFFLNKCKKCRTKCSTQ